MTVSVSLLISLSVCKQSCTTCLFISKSFKELFFVAFFAKADAKVRLIFELPKLFEVFFKKSFFWSGSPFFRPFVQYFNSSAFLSRKRMQNYCFTTYQPNSPTTFLALSATFFAKSLIFKRAVEHKNIAVSQHRETAIPYYLRTRALKTFPHLKMHWRFTQEEIRFKH